ncbi:MAG: NADH-quinone oxidoreductase subunit N [Acidobacteriota bacterium]
MTPVSFNPADLAAMAPQVALAIFGLVALVPDLVTRRRTRVAGHLAIAMAATVLAMVVMAWNGSTGSGPVTAFTGAFVVDRFSQFFAIVFLLSAILAMGMSVRLLDADRAQAGEYYSLILLATLGMMFMASGLDLLVIWLGLELMSLSSYVLCGFLKEDRKSSEAALKYFLLGAFSSGVLLYGISLVYGATGSTWLPAIRQHLDSGAPAGMLFSLGVVLMVAGLAFKVAAVPFHQWAPDVYEGAPTGITAFISTGSKAAGFAVLLRVFSAGLWSETTAHLWVPLVIVLAAGSMVVGNIAALLQDNVKRMLAYSSIGHAGYVLMGLVAIGSTASGADTSPLAGSATALFTFGAASILVYMLVYTFTTVGAFGVIAALKRDNVVGDRVEDFRGLARRHPVLSFAMLVFMLSLAGIPATAGFVGKWYLFGAAVRANYGWLAVLAVLMTTVSVYYYLRIVVAMYFSDSDAAEEESPLSGTLVGTLAVALIFTLVIGLYPEPFLNLATQGAAQLQSIWTLG